MIKINKLPQPEELILHARQQNANYGNINKDLSSKLKTQLLVEQGYLCAYCMGRVSEEHDKHKIEHILPQRKFEHKQLDYKNMVVVCSGGEGSSKKLQHCDTSKEDIVLSFNPLDPDIENKIKYSGARIKSDDLGIDEDLNKVLNLNLILLINNRQGVIRAVRKKLSRNNGKASKACVLSLIDTWKLKNNNKLTPYAGIAIYYLTKKLRQYQ